MKLYVINLDRAPERMARIRGLLQGMGVPFIRVPAVDGRELTLPAGSVPLDVWELSPGELALIKSHQKCWDLFDRTGDPYCMILEDDVHFGSGFGEFVTGTSGFPPEADLIKIEATHFKIWLDRHDARPAAGSRKLIRLASPHMGTAGYVLSRSGLPKIRALAAKFNQHPIDVVLFGPPAKKLTIYQLTPSIVIQDNALSKTDLQHTKKSIGHDGLGQTIVRGRKPKVRGLRRVMREIARPFRPYWPPGPLSQKWRLRYGRVEFE
jgi:glycosyl transferase, family 25